MKIEAKRKSETYRDRERDTVFRETDKKRLNLFL